MLSPFNAVYPVRHNIVDDLNSHKASIQAHCPEYTPFTFSGYNRSMILEIERLYVVRCRHKSVVLACSYCASFRSVE